MIRPAILALCLTASSVVAQASTTDRVLASTVIIGVQESAASGPSLYALPGQRPTWFRRLVHWLSYGSADVQRNAFAGEYYEAGAGAVIENGRILTAAHVVNIQGAAFTVRFRDGRRARAELEAIAPHHDAAVLRLTQSDATAPLPLARTAAQQVGERVLITGNPHGRAWWADEGRAERFGLFDYNGASHTQGLRRQVWSIDGEATHGNSGGPVTNDHGQLLGIVSSALNSPSKFAAVPADLALQDIHHWQAVDPTRTRLQCLQMRTSL